MLASNLLRQPACKQTCRVGIRWYGNSAKLPIEPAAQVAFRVGQIQHIELHPNADSLYVSQIAVESQPEKKTVTVCSGLVRYFTKQELQGRRVVLVSNLKSSKLRGITSEAMLLAAQSSKDPSVLELVEPPRDAAVGDALYFQGIEPQPKANVKPKTWQLVQEKLQITHSGVISYDGKHDLQDSNGDKAMVPTVREGAVS